jgi:hypothetical protein
VSNEGGHVFDTTNGYVLDVSFLQRRPQFLADGDNARATSSDE